MSDIPALLVLPRLRIQHANAISSPMTWGFPALSAFIGFMQALERRLPSSLELQLNSIGVICHDFDAQVTEGGFTHAFRLTRNPVGKDGSTAAIVEEGRVHLEVSLVIAVSGSAAMGDQQGREAVAQEVADIAAGMRIAGGSVMPPLPTSGSFGRRPELIMLAQDEVQRELQFKRLRRRWLPGFALVGRDDLLAARLVEMQQDDPGASVLDAWLDMARMNVACVPAAEETEDAEERNAEWNVRKPPGWVVPIPVGYGALSGIFAPGEVQNARDPEVPFRFVEALYSLGQWVSPHRIPAPEALLWYVHNDVEHGSYRLRNQFSKYL